jgi:serine kinase of HPr protein (carbohydrate metabolism regulator)
MRFESNDYKRVGRGYRLRADDALAVDEKGWYCHKRCTGGVTAIDYLVEIKGYGLVEAVCEVLGESSQERSDNGKYAKRQRKGKAAP